MKTFWILLTELGPKLKKFHQFFKLYLVLLFWLKILVLRQTKIKFWSPTQCTFRVSEVFQEPFWSHRPKSNFGPEMTPILVKRKRILQFSDLLRYTGTWVNYKNIKIHISTFLGVYMTFFNILTSKTYLWWQMGLHSDVYDNIFSSFGCFRLFDKVS